MSKYRAGHDLPCLNLKPVQMGNVWWPMQTFHRLATLSTLFGAVWSCLLVFGRVDKIWRPSNIRPNNLKHFSCLMGDVLLVWTAVSNEPVSNMFGACMGTTLAQWLVSIDIRTASCCSVFQRSRTSKEIWCTGLKLQRLKPKKRRAFKENKGKVMKSIVTKCMQVQQASVSRENRHESFASFRGNLEYPGISSIINSSSLLLVQLLVFPLLFSLFPSSSNMSRWIIVAIIIFNLNLWIATWEVAHSAILKSRRWAMNAG